MPVLSNSLNPPFGFPPSGTGALCTEPIWRRPRHTRLIVSLYDHTVVLSKCPGRNQGYPRSTLRTAQARSSIPPLRLNSLPAYIKAKRSSSSHIGAAPAVLRHRDECLHNVSFELTLMTMPCAS